MYPHGVWSKAPTLSEGGGRFESIQAPPPSTPLDPPKFLNTPFSKLRFLGKVLAPKAPNFFWPPKWVIFFLTRCVCTQNTEGEFKIDEKHNKKKVDP